MAVRNKSASDLLSNENLLFIDQKTAEGSTLTFDVLIPESVTDYEIIITTNAPDEPEDEPTVPPTEPSTEPTTKPVEVPTTTKPVVTVPAVKVEIRKPSQTEIKYGDSIVLHAEAENLPADAKIEWSADNSNFTIVEVSADGKTCQITPNANGDTVITVKIVDAKGNEISKDEQTMTAKAGFFQKIIAFFKKLFGTTKIYPEIFKGIF